LVHPEFAIAIEPRIEIDAFLVLTPCTVELGMNDISVSTDEPQT
jgi:hypothetical protein